MKIRIAELNIEILNRFGFMEKIGEKYLAEFSAPDLTLEATTEDIALEKTLALADGLDEGRLEAVAVCRKLGLALPSFDALMLHAATFELDGRGIAFLAKSGTGKSTHMLLWQKLFGDRLQIINGDKPIVRFEDPLPLPLAYGTPWCGKEGFSQNRSIPLTDLCFIRRSGKNETKPMDKSEALSLLLEQVVIPHGSENILKVLDLLDGLLGACNLWEIKCNTDLAAAEESSNIILR